MLKGRGLVRSFMLYATDWIYGIGGGHDDSKNLC